MTYKDIAIDGPTLEKRRDQRAEQLETFIGELSEDDRKGLVGKVNQWTKATGVQVVDQSQSLYDLESEEKQLRDVTETHVFDDLPPIVKRTPEQRLDSMVARLKTASPESVEPILKEIAGEYWKAGAPITTEALRTVASHYLNMTERKH